MAGTSRLNRPQIPIRDMGALACPALLLLAALFLPAVSWAQETPPPLQEEGFLPRILQDPATTEDNEANGLRIQEPRIAEGLFTGTVVNPADTLWRRASLTVTALAEEGGAVLWERRLELGDVPPGAALPVSIACPEGAPRPGHVAIGFRAMAAPPPVAEDMTQEPEPEAASTIEITKREDGSLRLIAK